jgi:hypothetical protein
MMNRLSGTLLIREYASSIREDHMATGTMKDLWAEPLQEGEMMSISSQRCS